MGEGFAALGAQLVYPIQNLGNPLLLRQRRRRDGKVSEEGFGYPPLPCAASHSTFTGDSDSWPPQEMEKVARVKLEAIRPDHMELG